MLIHANNAPYSPNTLNNGSPKQATQANGKGFFTAPERTVSGKLQRTRSSTFTKDFWSQPRLIFNSLVPAEQQFLVNAIRFETAHLKSEAVKKNVLAQLNKIHNGIAKQVAEVLNLPAPGPDPTFYHNNKTKGISVYEAPLLKLTGLKVGVLTTTKSIDTATINSLKQSLASEGVSIVVVAETLAKGVDATYSASDATDFDGVVVGSGASSLFASSTTGASSLYPAGRPLQILQDAYRYGKPVGFGGDASVAVTSSSIPDGPGVYGVKRGSPLAIKFNATVSDSSKQNMTKRAEQTATDLASSFKDGLRTFKFLDRFAVEKL
jgi:catalase